MGGARRFSPWTALGVSRHKASICTQVQAKIMRRFLHLDNKYLAIGDGSNVPLLVVHLVEAHVGHV